MNSKIASLVICSVIISQALGGIVNNSGISPLSSGDIIYVDDDNTGGIEDGSLSYPYNTIQEGIDAADPHDTVFVFNGFYSERIVIDKALIIEGESKENTIIDGGTSGDVVEINAPSVEFTGFQIQNSGTSSSDSGIEINSNNNYVSEVAIKDTYRGILVNSDNNIIMDTVCENNDNYGIHIRGDWNQIYNCDTINTGTYGIFSNGGDYNRITECYSTFNHLGFQIMYGKFNKIEKCTASDNTAGIRLHAEVYNTCIVECNSNENEDGITIQQHVYDTTITRCVLEKNIWGIHITEYSADPSYDNLIFNNLFLDNTISAWDFYTNIWDNGYPIGGNYWSDYSGEDFYKGPNQDIPGTDGIGDTPYYFSHAQDNYPFKKPEIKEDNKPVADAGPDKIVFVGDPVLFNGSASYDPDGTIKHFMWNFGDGTPWNLGMTPTHVFNNTGNYTVTLEVSDNNCSSDSDTCQVTVLDAESPLIANAGVDQMSSEYGLVQFDGSASYDPHDVIESYEWDFDSSVDSDGDGNFTNDRDARGPAPTHVYGDDGEYEVTLTIKAPGAAGGFSKVDQNVVFLADTSGSMTDEAIEFMKEGLSIYVNEMEFPDQGCVVTFGGTAVLMNHLTENYTQLLNDISMIPDPNGGTYMVSAIEEAIDEINGDPKQDHVKVIVLLTDGQPTDGSSHDVLDMAEEAKNNNITIYTIGLEPGSGMGGLDEELLKDVADITGGQYYYAVHPMVLRDIYRMIAEIVEFPGGPPRNASDTMMVTVGTLDPSINSIMLPSDVYQGVSATFTAAVTDLGSDDLTFVWDWGDGSSDTVSIHYNNGVSADPYPSPEINPMDVLDTVSHIYHSPGNYTLTLMVTDDDNGSCSEQRTIFVQDNLNADFSWSPDPQDEGYPVQFTDESSYSINDTMSWFWDFGGLGSSNNENPQFTFMDDGIYPVTLTITNEHGSNDSCMYNITILDLSPTADFTWSPDPQFENEIILFTDLSTSYPDALVGWSWDFGDGHTSSDRNTSHVYGDDGIFIVTLTVTDDDNSTGSISYNVTVLNVDPEVVIESVTMDVEIGLRVAGRKYNNVSMTLYEDGVQYGHVSIQRIPGSPDEQMAWVPKVLDLTRTYSAIVHYIPVDPPYLGANPVWIYIRFPNGSIQKIHHTFNVQQSKERDSNHWNHIDPWEVDLMTHLMGWKFDVEYHVTDPGSDDEILTFSYGSQNLTVIHLRNPPNPDPYPSAEIDPVDILDVAQPVYTGAGTIILTVKDDDNIRLGSGGCTDSFEIK